MSALVVGPLAGTRCLPLGHLCELPHVAGPAALLPEAGLCSALYRLGQRPPAGPSGVAAAEQGRTWEASLFVLVKAIPAP